ncbi:MAG: Secretion system protein E [Candidatus Jorgensenbacteria bacterium GW2011_GWC1_48_8]|uniref:Secretion system protein E n=1 Tax=Candidatus Jorgensenbacteria bacterium GW2011_GWC1_48_8 TaxID=1618666 RepID=A0A0G1X7G6_9BACT|nr:MAG: Secretion system protein E [Candidatus Jorgensenbacteria bacterium GW2011_GWC1_48_8]
MPNIKLVGFKKVKADELEALIAKEIRGKTSLADKVVITIYPGSTCVSAAVSAVGIAKVMPYFHIDNTCEPGAMEEFKQLTEVLKPFGFDIEWGRIKEFFPAPDFKPWSETVNVPTEDEKLEALSKELGVPRITLAEMTPDPELVDGFDYEAIKHHKIIPIKLAGVPVHLIVAMVDPRDLMAIDFMLLATGHEVLPRLCSEADFNRKLDELFRDSSPTEPVIRETKINTVVGTEANQLLRMFYFERTIVLERAFELSPNPKELQKMIGAGPQPLSWIKPESDNPTE